MVTVVQVAASTVVVVVVVDCGMGSRHEQAEDSAAPSAYVLKHCGFFLLPPHRLASLGLGA